MQTSLTRRWFFLFCLGLSLVPASSAIGEQAAGSVLSRVQTVDDPELGELLRVALERQRPLSESDQLKTVRAVTESYAQIKLLDRQIEQIQERIRTGVTPAELRHEMLLARAELESKRLKELANLREVMGVVPQYPFGEQPVSSLRTWLELNAVDGHVHVLERLLPFSQGENYRSVGLMSRTAALGYVEKQLARADTVPIRIEIHRTAQAIQLSEDLREAVIDLVKRAGRAMQTEIRMDRTTRSGFRFTLGLQPGVPQVTVTPFDLTHSSSRGTDLVDPNRLDSHLVEELSKPERLPAQFIIEYPLSLREQADELARTVEGAAERMGVSAFLHVTHHTWEPDPLARYIGRWQAIDRTEITEVVIRPQSNASISRIVVSDTGATEQSSSAKWSGTSRQITIQQGRGRDTYHGYINSEGNLILGIGNEPVAFKKAK